VIWRLSHRYDPQARAVADRHYNRQHPESPQFVPPGRNLVLYAEAGGGRAFWVTSWPFAAYVRHAWAGAWVCSAFRNEGAGLSSELIRQAVAATRWYRGEAASWRDEPEPELGMVTFVDAGRVRPKRDPGRCFIRAGFRNVGHTQKRGLVALQLAMADMPGAMMPLGANLSLDLDQAAAQRRRVG
jgi:hypothetical protein